MKRVHIKLDKNGQENTIFRSRKTAELHDHWRAKPGLVGYKLSAGKAFSKIERIPRHIYQMPLPLDVPTAGYR